MGGPPVKKAAAGSSPGAVEDEETVTSTGAEAAGGGGAATTVVAPDGLPPWVQMDSSWFNELSPELSKPYFRRLVQFVEEERRRATVYPADEDIFAALKLTPLDKVKVVILGQDPYHGPGQAHGLAFSVRRGVALPASLRNIVKEAASDCGTPQPAHGNLEQWAQQGVLLLNTVLTVRKGEAHSHKKKGWEEYTRAILRALNRKRNLVFLLWGKPAQDLGKLLDEGKHLLLKCPHPSPLSGTHRLEYHAMS